MPTLTQSEYARFRGVSKQAIRQAVRKGKLRTKIVNRPIEEVEITKAEYEEWLKRQGK